MRKPKPPKIVGLAILTTITIVFWVFYGLYSTLTKNLPVSVPEEILSPINPELDITLLDAIVGKEFYEKGQTQPLVNGGQQSISETQPTEVSPTPTGTQTP